MRVKHCVICIACGVLAALLYYAYLRAITPIVNEMAEEVLSFVDGVSEQTTTFTSDNESTD